MDAINDYVAESDNLIALHGEIQDCDSVLEAIESLLGRYAKDLATISTDIRVLQEQSQAMNMKLKNRRALKSGLSDFVERVVLLPSLIHAIMEAPPASPEFSSALQQLAAKLAFVAADEGVRRSAAYRDVAPELERLRLAAVTRCRDLLLEQIYGLRRPRAHIQAKQAALIRHRAAASFLRLHGGDIYTEVRAAYADKVSTKLLDIFRSYWASIERVEETVAGAEDLLGAPETNSTAAGVAGMLSMLSFGGSHASTSSAISPFKGGSLSGGSIGGPSGRPSSRSEAFALGDRAAVLAAIDAPPLILHEAESEGRKFPWEALFRSLSKLLMDTASHEYLFCCDFWGDDGRTAYKESFTPVTSFIQASLGTAVHDLHDPVAVLLGIRINREHSLALARRGIPALDDHFDAVNLQLWPRLKTLLDAQLASLKGISPESSGIELTPTKVHVVTRRYAALMAAVLALHADFLEGPLANNVERMRYSVMSLLLTLSRGFPQRGRGTVFLIHNFSHVVGVLKDAGSRPLPAPPSAVRAENGPANGSPGLGPAGDDVLAAFEESLSRATGLYVEARLMAGAPQLVAFVKRGEAAASHVEEGHAVPGFGPSEAAPVSRDFSGRWERIVEVLNREIGQDFGNTAAGRAVQQAAFTQLLLHWSRFLELLKRQGDAGAAVAKSAVPMPSIMYALKQHRLS